MQLLIAVNFGGLSRPGDSGGMMIAASVRHIVGGRLAETLPECRTQHLIGAEVVVHVCDLQIAEFGYFRMLEVLQ